MRLIVALPVLLGAVPAAAVVIPVANASFETLPAGGLPYCNGSGTGCFSIAAIPGWTNTGNSGQFQPLPPQLNTIPDGATIAYTNGGTIGQLLAVPAVAGLTYTLRVDLGYSKDVLEPGTVSLFIGATPILATGTAAAQFSGDFATFTATYTALPSDAGAAIRIELGSPGVQGDFDDVRLTASGAVPEPAAWGLMVAGFGMVGAALRRRTSTVQVVTRCT